MVAGRALIRQAIDRTERELKDPKGTWGFASRRQLQIKYLVKPDAARAQAKRRLLLLEQLLAEAEQTRIAA